VVTDRVAASGAKVDSATALTSAFFSGDWRLTFNRRELASKLCETARKNECPKKATSAYLKKAETTLAEAKREVGELHEKESRR
jgi:hypothetical protein